MYTFSPILQNTNGGKVVLITKKEKNKIKGGHY